MKSNQFFKIYKRFDKERKKNTGTAVSEKRKTEKKWNLFYNRLFFKAFKNNNHFFLFRKLIRSAFFGFCYQNDAKNNKRGNWERQIARNDKLQYSFQK